MSGKKPPRLELVQRVDLRVVEASGLATRTTDGPVEVLVVGDRTFQVTVDRYDPEGDLSPLATVDVSELPGWRPRPGDSQFEAIAADGGSLVAMMREHPPRVHVVDWATTTVVANIELTAPDDSPLAGLWDDENSRGEGLVLLRDGRLLVAKEKRPRALIEFAPPGSDARGLSREILLGPGERWEAPVGDVDYAPVAMWKLRGDAKRTLEDISSITVGPGRDLWLLSDTSRRLARLSLDTPLAPTTAKIHELQGVWRLPKRTEKPEAVAPLDDATLLIAMDTPSEGRNGFIARWPAA